MAHGRLTPRLERFCQEYMKDLNPDGAYQRAGFRGENVKANAARIMSQKVVKERIKELEVQRLIDNRVTVQKIVDRLDQIASKTADEGKYNAAIRANELLGKYCGMFVEKTAIELQIKRSPKEVDEEIKRLNQIIDNVPE